MESGILQIWLSVKWLVFAAIGSGISVLTDKEESTNKQKLLLFFVGAVVSIIAGGACIEVFQIHGGAVQGFIYWAWGLWGMGIILQITKLLPKLFDLLPDGAKNLIEKFTK